MSEPAAELAARHRSSRCVRRHAGRERRGIHRLIRRLHRLFSRIEACSRADESLPSGALELLDNLHVVEEALLQVGEDLPSSYLRLLPCVADGGCAPRLRVYEMAVAALAAAGGEVELRHLHRFVDAYQRHAPLSMGELWALPSMLRLRLLEVVADGGEALLEPVPAEGADPPRREDMARDIRGLRRLAIADWHDFFEAVSAVERLLRRDPAGVYATMDFASRDAYRKAVEALAGGRGEIEEAVARQALELARRAPPESRGRHVGYYLMDAGMPDLLERLATLPPADVASTTPGPVPPSGRLRPLRPAKRLAAWIRHHGTGVLLGPVGMLTGVFLALVLGLATVAGGTPWQILILGLISLVPATTLATTVTTWVLTVLLEPARLPRLRLRHGVPRGHRTLVVFPCLLTGADEVASLLRGLEVNMLANRDPNLQFALLSDWADASEAAVEGDDELLQAAVRGVEALNREYGDGDGGPFHLLHRRRLWNPREGCFMGWERKRGKLEELNRLLMEDGETTFETRIGDVEFLHGVRYVITLDADTLLPRGAARELVATIAHPLNRASFDDEGRVTAGYTVLQPRIEITPESASRSRFARIYSGTVGLDLYTHAVSDVYQDLVGEGIYAGKGIYDVASFHRSLARKVPEGTLLSHDLFEGLQGRAGLVSDVVVLEDHPSHVLSYLDRFHRWVRGDWQLLPWLLPRVPTVDGGRAPNPLSALDRWKIFDNLRRSLVPPFLFAFLLACWSVLPGSHWLWTAIAVGTLAVTLPLETVIATRRLLRGEPWRTAVSQGTLAIGLTAMRVGIELALLPAQATLAVDAVGRTLYRLSISRRRLLEWTTAAWAARRLGRRPRASVAWHRMVAGPILAVAFAASTVAVTGGLPAAAVLFLGLWVVSPQLAHLLSRPWHPRRRSLPPAAQRTLRLLARRTWHFFESFVTPEDHWLPPDSFQEEPGGKAARQTSPTNIGFYLLSLQEAFDLGYLDVESYTVRLRATLDTLTRMSRYRGHFWNWYSTESLAALEPRYVSTVDSGNLAACLLTVAAGVDAVREGVRPPRRQIFDGLADLVGLLADAVARLSDGRLPHRGATLSRRIAGRTELDAELATLEDRLRGHDGALAARRELLVELHREVLPHIESRIVEHVEGLSGGLPSAELLGEVRIWAELLAQAVGEVLETARNLTPERTVALDGELAEAASVLRDLARGMDFRFLFDRRRKLFHLGYNATAGQLDPNHYDLLASEARLASFVAIAKGDVPVEHWLHLGRPFSRVAGDRALLSWGGTAFEHLLPNLLLDAPAGSTLAVSARAVVRQQMAFARRHRLPWGVSESGFSTLNAGGWYQYRAFGVPGTGLKRGLGDRLVISPYASLLALDVAPRDVLANLDDLGALGLVGRYGLYEAADFGSTATGKSRRPTLVRSYMSHHQGMIMASLAGAVLPVSPADRFHADPEIATVGVLLHEEVRFAPLTHTWVSEERRPASARMPLPTWMPRDARARPQLQVLGSGSLRLLISDSGAGGSTWQGTALTPWQPDPTRELHGTWIYLRDEESGAVWSAGRQPSGAAPDTYSVQFSPHQVEIHRADRGILTHLAVRVAARVNLEARTLRLANDSDRRRRLSVTSVAEPLLAAAGEAGRHPAFARLFVETEWVADVGALVARRRPRAAGEQQVFYAHAMAPEPAEEWEGDRRAFLGRDGSVRHPRGLATRLAGTVGATLDPVLALRRTVTLEPGEEVEISLLAAAGSSHREVLDLLQEHRSPSRLALLAEESENRAREDLHAAGLPPEEAPLAQKLLSAVLLPSLSLRAGAEVLRAEHAGRSGLWGHGLSGDLPILLVRAGRDPDLEVLRTLLRVHAFWRRRRVEVDLVVLDEVGEGYGWPLRERLDADLTRTGELEWLHRSGGVFLLRARQLPAVDRTLLLAAADVVLGTATDLPRQLAALDRAPVRLPEFVPVPSSALTPLETPPLERPTDLVCDNGLGGFTPDGREYVVHPEPGAATPTPWINVVANRRLGFLVSESGASTTWALDSSENRLTPWPNDPIRDPIGEALYLRDEETGEVWTPTRHPAGEDAGWQARHGAGYSVLRHRSHGLEQALELFVPREDPVKIACLTLTNLWPRPRRVTATYYAEWVLGDRREHTARYIVPDIDAERGALLARNPFHPRQPDRVAFLAADRKPHGFTCDRAELLGRGGTERPDGLRRIGFAGTVQPGIDPCAALQIHVDIPAGATVEAHFLLGQGEDGAEARRLVERYRDRRAVAAARREIDEHWDRLLGTVQVRTPELEIDLLANRWLLYQTLACRILGRAGLYQASGAYGFRDQLQDVTALLIAAPKVAREHILEAARRQFAGGDVLHWWHPETTRGLRSRCSDDLVWLPWATAQYVEATGDSSILDEAVPFLSGPELEEEENERYDDYPPEEEAGTLYEHCLRALERASTRGRHGLPLIGSSDWNDGFDRVGREGRGESVWLGFFLYAVLEAFAAVCTATGDEECAGRLRRSAREYREAIEGFAWGGAWYTRAWYDDGTPLGAGDVAAGAPLRGALFPRPRASARPAADGDSADAPIPTAETSSAAAENGKEAEIDLVVQAWAVLSGGAEDARAAQAIESAWRRLADRDHRLLPLLAPPFDRGSQDPGYIKAYPPGVRENGGQYNHAATWAAWALARLGRGEEAMELVRWIHPLYRAATRESATHYRLEPYAVAGDICAVEPHAGRGGWSWYTGSAGWLYRLILEAILGLRVCAGRLRITPCLPPGWPGFEAVLRAGASGYHIRVRNEPGPGKRISEVSLDGHRVEGAEVTLADDGEEHVVDVDLRVSESRSSAANGSAPG